MTKRKSKKKSKGFIRDQDKGKDITVDLSKSDLIADISNTLEKELGGKVIEVHAKYSDWQLIYFEQQDIYVLVRTVFRLVRNVVQLFTLQELIESYQEKRDEFTILEYDLQSDEFTHEDIEEWNNPRVETTERVVNDYYIDREQLIIEANDLLGD